MTSQHPDETTPTKKQPEQDKKHKNNSRNTTKGTNSGKSPKLVKYPKPGNSPKPGKSPKIAVQSHTKRQSPERNGLKLSDLAGLSQEWNSNDETELRSHERHVTSTADQNQGLNNTDTTNEVLDELNTEDRSTDEQGPGNEAVNERASGLEVRTLGRQDRPPRVQGELSLLSTAFDSCTGWQETYMAEAIQDEQKNYKQTDYFNIPTNMALTFDGGGSAGIVRRSRLIGGLALKEVPPSASEDRLLSVLRTNLMSSPWIDHIHSSALTADNEHKPNEPSLVSGEQSIASREPSLVGEEAPSTSDSQETTQSSNQDIYQSGSQDQSSSQDQCSSQDQSSSQEQAGSQDQSGSQSSSKEGEVTTGSQEDGVYSSGEDVMVLSDSGESVDVSASDIGSVRSDQLFLEECFPELGREYLAGLLSSCGTVHDALSAALVAMAGEDCVQETGDDETIALLLQEELDCQAPTARPGGDNLELTLSPSLARQLQALYGPVDTYLSHQGIVTLEWILCIYQLQSGITLDRKVL